MDDRTFIRRVLYVVLIVGLALVAWQTAHALLMLFGAVLFAIILRGLARQLRRVAPVPDTAAVGLVLLGLLLVIGGLSWLMGSLIAGQFSELAQSLPGSLQKLQAELSGSAWGRRVLDAVAQAGQDGTGAGQIMSTLGKGVLAFGNATLNLLLVLIAAIYFALQPRLYRRGVQLLAPAGERTLIRDTLFEAGDALWKWSVGMGMQMLIIGLLVAIGLWLLDVPAALALGLIAGLLEFIPIAGPFLMAIPGVLLAFVEGPDRALYVALFYLAVQQIEGHVVLPLIQRHAVELPPVIAVFSLVIFGILFGTLGVLFATPLAVAVMVLVQKLYVQEALGTPVPVEGKKRSA
jgi:predicted PurR-regulated permease PerM